MVEAADLRNGDDSTGLRPLDRPRLRRILVQSKVCPALVIVGHETTVAAQVSFSGDEHVIQALPADRANDAFDAARCQGDPGVDSTSDIPNAVT